MNSRLSIFSLLLLGLLGTTATFAQSHRVYEQGELPNDIRLQEPKDLNGYFPFELPAGKAAWEKRSNELRRQVLVSTGLWPMPERTPLNPVIHGKVQRDGFTVEKVYLESVPGHFVTGLLFRPDDGKTNVKRPAVLCPHGHGGRLQDHGTSTIQKLIESGDEKYAESGRFPKLARCAHLARMGCVTFIFDMLGYGDSHQISYELAHRYAKRRPEFETQEDFGLFSTQAELRLQSVMGIQTWNSIRCLDFLEQLPDVDGSRMAVTGGSGGGTQTILLCAIDPRPIAAFPNGMVSTSMQGGCTCENCTLLRVGTGNVELAALFAPRPQAMTAANDWTKEMMTKGYPELQQLYDMLGSRENVYCRPMLHFNHNYNYVSRATMYAWFNEHLKLGLDEASLEERDYQLLTPEEYTVWNDDHPQPKGGDEYERSLMRDLADASDRQLAKLTPTDAGSLQKYRNVVGEAFQAIVGRDLPKFDDIQRIKVHKESSTGYILFKDKIRLDSQSEELPVLSLFPIDTKWNGEVTIWADGAGKRGLFDASGAVRIEVRRLLDDGMSVVAADLFGQGDFLTSDQPLAEQRVVKNPRESAAYTFAYNDTLFVRRVHDLLTLLAWIRGDEHQPKKVHLIGVSGAGPVAALARAIAGDKIDSAAIDTKGFRFTSLTSYRDPDFLPGVVKYGDLPAILALNAPHPLWIAGERGKLPELVSASYSAAGTPQNIQSYAQQDTLRAAVDWVVSK
ncbi:MAG TPA: alpha/beta hydrolase family protein [Planctomycetaceae bacterium]|nr:alpha/beta hydrolase family protein [Planctomycetaceae bacterium]